MRGTRAGHANEGHPSDPSPRPLSTRTAVPMFRHVALVALPTLVAGHAMMVQPRPRNSIEGACPSLCPRRAHVSVCGAPWPYARA